MKRFFTYILAALFSLYLLVSLAWGNAAARHRLYKGFSVTVVDSARAQYVTAAEVAAHLSKYIKADENTLLQDINTEDLEEQLYQNRLIEEVRCYKTPSGLLRVDISPRVPILRVLGDSAAYFLDEHGIADIVESVDGKRRVVTERVRCDLYDYLSRDPQYEHLFNGLYLLNYSWAETTLGELQSISGQTAGAAE